MSSPKLFRIGLLGTGNIGTTLATKLVEAGHTVKAANSKGPETLPAVFSNVGVEGVWAKDAVKDVDVIIISTPPSAFSKTKALLADLPESVAVLDTFNHYPFRDGEIQEIEDGKVESIWASEQLGRGVTKVWNNIYTESFKTKGKPKGSEGRLSLPVSSDNEKHLQIAMQLVEDTGFTAYNAGSLSESWRQQPGTPAYCTDCTQAELPKALERARRDLSPGNRDAGVAVFTHRFQSGMDMSADWIKQFNRLVNN